MSGSRLQRIRAMGREELAFRARAAARAHLDRVSVATKTARWSRADLSRVLAAYVLDLPMKEAIRGGDWRAVQRRLEDVFRSRPSRFPIDPDAREDLRVEVARRWPSAAVEARARADRILGGQYDLLGYRGLRFTNDGTPDWHFDPVSGRRSPRTFWADVPYLDPAVGDHKVIWELNRHQHWLALGRALWLTGDRRERRQIVVELHSWLAENPPLVGINWASMLELAFRSLSWLSALHLLLGAPAAREGRGTETEISDDEHPWLVDMLVGLHHHLEHVSRNLSCYFSPNTHLLGEALALYVAGQALPEMARSPRWSDLGRRILLAQIDRQIEPDGGHAERSLHYHRYALDFYLLALLTAERCGDDDASAAFRRVVSKMASFLREMAGDDGRLPLIGDDDGGMLWPITGRDPADVRDSLALAAAVLGRPDLAPWGPCEEALWLGWGYRDRLLERVSLPAPGSETRVTVFPATGYVVARDGEGGHLVFDTGRHGFLNCGHAHADALAVTLSVSGAPLLVDPGTGSYTADISLRDRMRRTANHNTLTVGGRSSSTPAGPFHWRSQANATLETVIANPRFGWMEASHDGYPGVRHRRSVVQASGGWLIVDELLGEKAAGAQTHWHFSPEWAVACESDQALSARHEDGASAWLVHDACAMRLAYGDEESGLGWYSPRYGTIVPTWSARLSRSIAGPVSLVTWIGAAAPREGAPSLERIQVGSIGDGAIISVRLRRDAMTCVTAVRPGGSPGAGPFDSAGYRTDARLLHYTLRADNTLESLAIAEGVGAAALSDNLISVDADRTISNIHVALHACCLELRTSAPPVQLRLNGRALDGITSLRLNGRTAAAPRRASDGSVVVSGGDWPAPGLAPGVDLCVA